MIHSNKLEAVREYIQDSNNQYNKLFDVLLRTFYWEKLNIDLYKVPVDKDSLAGFDILYFAQGSKKQFVSTITKEVLFEVELMLPKYEEGTEWEPKLTYVEYWR